VRVSDRRVAEAKLHELGVQDMQAALTLIDKELLGTEKAAELLSAPTISALQEWLREPFGQDGDFGDFLGACRDFGVDDFLEPDKNIVRGLAYYTGIVWEIFDRKRTLRAVAGGGRYDTLIERMGGPAMPALGFGMGDVVLGELLKDLDLLPATPARIDALVVAIGDEMMGAARQVVAQLRARGTAAEASYSAMKLGKAFKAAERAGASEIYIVGAEEWARGEVQVKNLASGEQRIEPIRAT
jgi:histidyl-tRNA synthetase